MKKKINEILAPFSLGHINDLMNLAVILEENGYNVKDSLKRHHDQEIHKRMQEMRVGESEAAVTASILRSNSPLCPDCGRPMIVVDVNSQKYNKIPGDAKSLWQCVDLMNCGYEKENKFSAEIETKSILSPHYYKDGSVGVDPAEAIKDEAMRSYRRNLKRSTRPLNIKPCGGRRR